MQITILKHITTNLPARGCPCGIKFRYGCVYERSAVRRMFVLDLFMDSHRLWGRILL